MGNAGPDLHDVELKNLYLAMEKRPGFERERFLTLLEDTDEKTVLNILARFDQTLAAALVDVAAAEDVNILCRVFHKVAGSAELLGFVGLGRQGRDLDGGLRRNPDPASFADGIANFEKLGAEIKTTIAACCPGLGKYLLS